MGLFCQLMPGISIIIITYNRPDDTIALLKDLHGMHRQDLLEEVIVLNNASTTSYDEVTEFLGMHPDWPCRFVAAPENLGVSRGRNYAATLAKGNILFFLDDDIAIEDRDLLEKLNKAFGRQPYEDRSLGVVACKVRYFSNRQLQVNAFPHKQFDRLKECNWFPTYYYVGCAHAFTRTCWTEAGPYPEDFFYGMEEYDESYRVLADGHYIAYDASVEVFHKESPGGRHPRAAQLRMMWVNKSVVAYRYLPGIYFYTTALLWSFQMLVRSGGHFAEWRQGWKQVFAIPRRVKKQRLDASTLLYLRKVKARLWF